MPDFAEINQYSDIDNLGYQLGDFHLLRTRKAERCLKQLKENSATGPDGIATRILRILAKELALPFCKLARLIISAGEWPDLWTEHWICPIHKKKSRFLAANYRGTQLTAQLSKASERFIGNLFLPYLVKIKAYGDNQFAYSPGRGARDLVLILICSWLLQLAYGRKIVVYCSDVSGAFDKVDSTRLLLKLKELSAIVSVKPLLASSHCQRSLRSLALVQAVLFRQSVVD